MRSWRVLCASLGCLALVNATEALAQRSSADAVALVIGNAKYPDGDAPIASAAEDARALGAELQRRGFDTEIIQDATKRSIREASDRLLGKVRRGGAVAVYFAGYGIQTYRQNYLVPVDAQIWTEMDLQRDGLNVERLLAELERRGAGATFVILDAAYRNPFERRFRSFSTGLAPLKTPPPDTSVIFSTAPGAVLKPSNRPRGIFAEELVKQIQAAGGLSHSVLEATRATVSSATQNEQKPWIFVGPKESGPGKDVVAGLSGDDRRPPPAANPPPEARRPPSEPAVDVAAEFRTAQGLATKQAYADFLARHRTGSYADQARAEIAKLDAAALAESDFRAAQSAGTKQALEDFLGKHPTARQADLARSEIAKLNEAALAQTAADFRKAQQTGTKAAFEEFLGKHKTGPQIELARAEILRLDELAAATAKRSGPRVPYSSDDEMLLADLNRRVAADPNDSGALYTRGQIHAVHEDFPRALADFDKVVRLNPGDVEALNNRCWVRAILDELDGALADCNGALKIRPDFLDALDSRGFVNLKIGLPRRAVADYDAALKVDATHVSALYGRGVARSRIGDAAQGKADIAKALKMHPGIAEEFTRFGIR